MAPNIKNVEFKSFGREEQMPERVLARAEAEAARLLEDARKEAERLEQEAYERGFAQGERDGLKMGLAQAQPSVAGAASLMEQLNGLLYQTLEAMEPEIIRLVRVIAEKVLFTLVAQDHEIVVKVVRAAIAEVDKKWSVVVRVSPAEWETLQGREAELARIRDLNKLELIADPDVEPGGCRVEWPAGFVDASIRRALEELFRGEDG